MLKPLRHPETVDEYISAAPEAARAKLREVRRAIIEAAPEATESISYRIPYYFYKGRLAWFGFFKEHIGLFVRPPVLDEHKEELKGYTMTKSSLHLPLDREMPLGVVKKLVRYAIAKNEERVSA
jgi:uncharacterized protein YdhG (YjbR/CyaY superfamily)